MSASLYYEEPGIQLWHGDCREWLPTLAAGSVDLVVADPPYGVSVVQRNGRVEGSDVPSFRNGRYAGMNRVWEPIAGDDAPFEPSHLLRFPRLALFGANHYTDRLPVSGSWIVWDKRNGATPDDNADAELIWTNLGGPVRLYAQCWRGYTRENDSMEPNRSLHPTQKPVALMQWLMDRYTRPDDLVVDPYAGCGPVLVAGKRMGRRVLACELSEAYCEIAARRLRNTMKPLAFDPTPEPVRQRELELVT